MNLRWKPNIPTKIFKGNKVITISGDSLKTDDATLSRVMRALAAREELHPGERANYIEAVVHDRFGNQKGFASGWNSRTDQGANWQAQLMGNAAGTPALYVALSAASLTITKTDTFMGSNSVGTNEIAANGCTRALGSYGTYVAPTVLGGVFSFVITKVFTATGSQVVVGIALCNSATPQSASVMFEANLATSTLANTDTITTTYTISA